MDRNESLRCACCGTHIDDLDCVGLIVRRSAFTGLETYICDDCDKVGEPEED